MKWIFNSHSLMSWQFQLYAAGNYFASVSDCSFQQVISVSIKANFSFSFFVLKSHIHTLPVWTSLFPSFSVSQNLLNTEEMLGKIQITGLHSQNSDSVGLR